METVPIREVDENCINDQKTGKMCRIDLFRSKVFTFMSSNRKRRYKLFLSLSNGNTRVERVFVVMRIHLQTNELI